MRSAPRIVTVLFALVAVFSPLFAFGQTPDELQKQIDDHNAQIAALNKDIALYQTQLDVVSEKKQSLQNTLTQLDISRKKLTASINVTKNQIKTTQLQIQQLSQGIVNKERSIQMDEAALGESLRRLDEAETKTLAVQILTSDTISAAWQDIDALQQLQAAVYDNIRALANEKKTLTETKKAQEQKRVQLLAQQSTLVAQQGSLDATRKAQSELLTQTKAQESTYQAILRQKQAEKESFEKALFELASKLEYALDPSRIPAAETGVLRWPLDNVFITQQFGRTSSSRRLYVSGTHDGIDFRAAIGTPVRASLSGAVIEVNHGAVQNCQYGKWVLIKHNNGLTTLYAHLSQISVSKGQSVATGQIIGYSGNTGYATGPHLHFTVYASDAVTFKNYTCKSGRSTMIPIANPSAYLNPLDYL